MPVPVNSLQLLASLKRVFREAGIHYAEIALALGVSEMTIKRLLSGKGLKLDTLDRLCEIAHITLFELVEMTRAANPLLLPPVTLAQARELADEAALGTIFFLIDRGWTAEQIAEEFGLDGIVMNRHLTKLDRIKVIALFPGNRVRLLRRISKDLRYQLTGSNVVGQRAADFFRNFDLSDKAAAWTSGVARLSAPSFAQVSEVLDELRDTIFALGDRDLKLPPGEVQWYSLFAGVKPVKPDGILIAPDNQDPC